MLKLFIFLFSLQLYAFNSSEVILEVGEAKIKKSKIAILLNSNDRVFRKMIKILEKDFSFYPSYFDLDVINGGKVSSLRKKYDVVVEFNEVLYKSEINLNFKVWKKGLSNFTFQSQVKKSITRRDAHQISHLIFFHLVGRESIFLSKIVFVSSTSNVNGKQIKELFIMDYDGFNVKQLTRHKSVVISPSISKDRKLILYSVVKRNKGIKNVDLYVYDREKRRSYPISRRKGINSGAIFHPDGKHIILTLSFGVNADIFQLPLYGGPIQRVTRHPSDDVDPSISEDGKKLVFLSGRSGKAMIYLMDYFSKDDENAKRISFVGKFNATPRFSPDGKEIVFASWPENSFDIFRMDLEGKELVRLTKNFGSNEDPSFSSDGQFIVFSSQRVLSRKKATYNVYIMDRNGNRIRPLTKNMGDCISPRWSK